MPYETEERLKSYLDSNQLHREQMCLAALSLDRRFTNVRPRHPRGGPDGGRDIEATYMADQTAYAAVGFMNQCADTPEHKKAMRKKFEDDLRSALTAVPKVRAFFFLTNINFTVKEKEDLVLKARRDGFGHCEIFDRERLRILLDSPDGFAARFQYLGLSMSEPEQASFFSKWGDDIQSVISTGFQHVQGTLDRVLFYQEASSTLSSIWVNFELDREYSSDEVSHFRAFYLLCLKEPKLGIFFILFGSADGGERIYGKEGRKRKKLGKLGIQNGISGGQWEQYLENRMEKAVDFPEFLVGKYKKVGSSCSIGKSVVKNIAITYTHDHFVRLSPRLFLRDMDEALSVAILNASLAEKVKRVSVFANEYKLLDVPKDKLRIDKAEFDPDIPVTFTPKELADPWVRIRPDNGSSFDFKFSTATPKRIVPPRMI